jgi:Fe-S cluster biogenesis protein NfuA
MREEVQRVIQEIRPNLQAHGGDVELVDVHEDGKVSVRLQGACAGCPHARATLQQGVEARLKEAVPAVTEVVAVE